MVVMKELLHECCNRTHASNTKRVLHNNVPAHHTTQQHQTTASSAVKEKAEDGWTDRSMDGSMDGYVPDRSQTNSSQNRDNTVLQYHTTQNNTICFDRLGNVMCCGH